MPKPPPAAPAAARVDGRTTGRRTPSSRSTGEGGTEDAQGRAIDVLVGRLRSKIEKTPKDPKMLRTERGVGYVFAVDVTTEET